MTHEGFDAEPRADTYRENARVLRRLAFETQFDFCRRAQLHALAAAFERLADKLERSSATQTAD